MKIGAVYPQTEIGNDPAAVREYAQAVESLGYDHILAFDHVVGANAESRPGWSGAYRHTDSFHEPFVLFSYLAGITQGLEFVSGIIILPQRQTVLVAKQASTLDFLSGGRLRLGIGTGWNEVEYEALGENFHNRGRRSEEQIELMRALWTNELVTFEGKWHKITDAGLNPLPAQRPIPVWLGGRAEQVLKRVGRIGDGWFPMFRPEDDAAAIMERLWTYAAEAGRDSSAIGIESGVSVANRTPDEWRKQAEMLKSVGATHITVNTMRAGFKSPSGHIKAVEQFKDATSGL